MMGFLMFAAEDLSRLMHTLQALARGDWNSLLLINSTMKRLSRVLHPL